MNLQSLLLFAAEEAEGGGHAEERTGLDLVLPPMEELIWGIVAFAIVATFLMKVAFPKIRQAVEAREQQIQSALEEGERAKAEAKQMQSDYQRQLADARSEANRIVEEARQQAEQVRKDLIAKAEQEAQNITTRAQEQIDAERARAAQELRQTLGTISVQLAERIVQRSLDQSAHNDLVESYIKEVAGTAAGNGSPSGGAGR